MTGPVREHDEREIYCRRLGHHLHFAYCRATDGSAPCHKILDCWFERFDVASYLARHLGEEGLRGITAPPPPKLSSLVELVARARARTS